MAKALNKDFVKTAVFALLVAIVLLFAVFEIKKFKAEEEVKEVKDRVLNFDPDTVNRISYQGVTLIRDQEQGVWRAVSPYTDYLNYKAVEDWLSKAMSFDGRKLSDADEEVRWIDFGFKDDSPTTTYFSEKNAYKVSLSPKTTFDGSSYLKYQKNKESPVLISSNPEWRATFAKSAAGFRSLKVFDWTVPEPSAEASALKVKIKNREVLSIAKENEAWVSKREPKWTLDSVKVNAFLSDLKQYMHKGFSDGKMRLENPEVSLYVGDQRKNGFSVNIHKVKKETYAVVSYRPEHVLKIDKEALEDFSPESIEFRNFSDLIMGFSIENTKALKIRKNGENKVFRMKDGLWTKTDGKKIPAGFEFNGAKVFKVLESFKAIQYKRYVKEKDVIFKSSKRKLYFYKDSKNIDLTYSVGQNFPCSLKSKSKSQCILVATNKVQGYYGVALRPEVEKIFKYGFIQKIQAKEKETKPAKSEGS